jgi:hypothetical protein
VTRLCRVTAELNGNKLTSQLMLKLIKRVSEVEASSLANTKAQSAQRVRGLGFVRLAMIDRE